MNNSKLTIDEVTLRDENPIDVKPFLRERQTEIVEIIEALEAVNRSKYWQTLQSKVFHSSLEVLQRAIRTEKDAKELFRIQGSLIWGEKYTNLQELITGYRRQLDNIKNQIKQ
jgi:ERCC4-related helicase